jgi:6-phosphogluconolactonase (cycloisomerase 2 family)
MRGTILVFDRDPSTGSVRHRQTLRHGVDGVGGMSGATAVEVTSDGKQVYVAGVDAGTVAVFSRNLATGELTFVEKHSRTEVPSLDGATSLAFSPDQRQLYVGGLGNGTVTVFQRNPDTGALTFASAATDGVDRVDGLAGARDVVVSPDGKHLYAAGLAENAVVAFGRDPDTGALTYIEHEQNGQAGVEGLVGVWGLALSPDGKHLYVASQFDDSLTVFARDAGTGALSYVETRKQEEEEVDGMKGAVTVRVSGDGTHVYLAGSSEGAIAVFGRNPETGKLTFIENVRDRKGDVRGLGGVFNLVLTDDGRQLYAAAFDDGAIAHFRRDPATGKLTFVDALIRSGDDAPL